MNARARLEIAAECRADFLRTRRASARAKLAWETRRAKAVEGMMGEENGQRTPGGAIKDGRGWDGQHRDGTPASDNGMRTTRPDGVEVGQERGGDLQSSVKPPSKDLDTSTERSE